MLSTRILNPLTPQAKDSEEADIGEELYMENLFARNAVSQGG